jgi:hypothetical protein
MDMTDTPKIKITFAPGCFDTFEGTQEELDELVESVKEMFSDPEQVLAMSTDVETFVLPKKDKGYLQ